MILAAERAVMAKADLAAAKKMWAAESPLLAANNLGTKELHQAIFRMAKAKIELGITNFELFLLDLRAERVAAKLGELSAEELVVVKRAWKEAKGAKGATNTVSDAESLIGIISQQIRREKQLAEHTIGGKELGMNSYLNNIEDAKMVIDAAHNGNARILSTNLKQNRAYVQFNDITGFYNNNGIIVPTNKFLIKGIKSASVVPIHPSTTVFK